METSADFIWRGLVIRQEPEVFKIGTDALLLGAWIPKNVHGPNHILDAGTGTGVLALIMGLYFPHAVIVGIDDDPIAVRLAEYNFKQSGWPERITANCENILEARVLEKSKYDLVLCNPPFFFDQLEARKEVNKKAKHATVHSAFWLKALTNRLKPGGHLSTILPYTLSFDWITSANKLGLYCQQRLDVYSYQEDKYPKRTLLHFHENLVRPEISRIEIYDKQNVYSKEYMKLCGNT